MIYTVTTNPNIDYYMDLRAPLRVGSINRSGHELLAPGGKGINVSLMLRTLGKPSCVLGYLAGPTGRLLESLMEQTGCSCHWFWLQSGQTRINTKINTSPETAFNAAGPALAQADIDALCAFLRGLAPDDQLVISGNLQKSPTGAFSALLSAAQEAGERRCRHERSGASGIARVPAAAHQAQCGRAVRPVWRAGGNAGCASCACPAGTGSGRAERSGFHGCGRRAAVGGKRKRLPGKALQHAAGRLHRRCGRQRDGGLPRGTAGHGRVCRSAPSRRGLRQRDGLQPVSGGPG